MAVKSIMKRVRVAARSGILWAIGWAAGSFLVFQALLALGMLDERMFWADGLLVAARLGMAGGVTGAAFSLFIGVWYRGRRLSGISWPRFAVTGALLAGVYVPAFLLTMNLLSGGGFPVRHVMDDALLAAFFGALMAGGSMKLAQSAESGLMSDSEREPGLGRPGEAGMVSSGDVPGGQVRTGSSPRATVPRRA
jgi:hypothetical protein